MSSADRSIGGYFELESLNAFEPLHQTVALQSGRSCLRLLIEHLQPERAFIPYYCCDSVVSPFQNAGVAVERYCLDANFEIDVEIELGETDCLVAIDYFGLKTQYCKQLIENLGQRVWLDNTQNFYERPGSSAVAFNSARKFFGVSDGAYLYATEAIVQSASELPRNTDYHTKHLFARRFGCAADGFTDYKLAESSITDLPRRISYFSDAILGQLDYEKIRKIRLENFEFLAQQLNPSNQLGHLIESQQVSAPFVYPYLPNKPMGHQTLWDQQIFAPVLWPECDAWLESECVACGWHQQLLPLPIDHRYGPREMQRIVSVIETNEKRT